MAHIEFVNHASFIVRYNDISLITDPWIEGTAFHEGWKLIEPTKFTYADFASITHIWFSHEHPDHFNPPNLKSIPAEIRANITILFQATKDKKVLRFCEQLGFKSCIELEADWFELTPGFRLLNMPHTDGDSWLCIKAGEETLLNVNDCVFEDVEQLLQLRDVIDAPAIDVLFTQFSYANWAGNKEEREVRKQHALRKMQEIERQVTVLEPRFTVPFASYIWFCHSENFYMNDEINKVDFIYEYIRSHLDTKPVVLFPGEKWEVGEERDTKASVWKWQESYRRNIRAEHTIDAGAVTEAELLRLGNAFITGLKKNNTRWMSLFIKPSHIYIEDYEMSYRLSLKGFERASISREHCDISLSSDAMQYSFKFLWGGSTTRINGRYQVPRGGRFYNWKMYFQTSELNNHGEKFGLKFILQSLLRNLRRKIYGGWQQASA